MLLEIDNKLIDIKDDNILYNLYYNLAKIPDKKILKNKKIKNINIFISNLKDEISRLNNFIPLYDIYSKNIYLINPNEIYDKITKNYNRPLNKELYDYLSSIKTDDKNLQEKLNKNLKFMDNFNLKILEETYVKAFYYNSNEIGRNFTLCLKPSFLPFININPYYNRDELINMALNLKLIKEDNTFYDKEKLDKLCNIVSSQDIDSNTLLNHYLFIQENNLKYYIKYYSFMGSYQMNSYIRNSSIKDLFIENNIKNFYEIISKSPKFNNDYYLYRLIYDDNFLKDLKINDEFTDISFMSTSRNPFYNPKTNAFGQILMKIKIPKNTEGIGLCIENYSLFTEEQEIILNPCKLKLISKDDNIIYYHTDKKAQRSIKKKYEFEYISPIKLDIDKISKNYEKEILIPTIDLFNTKLIGSTIEEKLESFTNIIPLINTSKRFYIDINNNKYLLNVNKMSDKRIYEKYFFLQKQNYDNNDIIEELYITYQNEKTCEIQLIIEIKDVISVNYLQKFIGCSKEFDDNILLELISGFSKMFNIYDVIIHPNFKPFSTIINVKASDFKRVIDNETDYHEIQKLSNDIILYNDDLMNYIINNKDRFTNININLNYKRYLLENLKNIKINDVFTEINYEIYSIIKNTNLDNLNQLIIYFFKNYFYLLDKVIYYINVYFDKKLVINKLYYIFKTEKYLYEKGKINYMINNDINLLNNYINKFEHYNIITKKIR